MTVASRPARAALALLVTLPAAALAQQPPLAGLDSIATVAIREFEHPGIAIAIVKNDTVVYAKGFGVRKLGDPTPVDAHTLFAIGSSSKAFTGLAAAMMVDEKKIGWDDPMSDRLPGFQLSDPYLSRQLTIRDALTHRSGLARTDLVWISEQFDSDELIRRLRFVEPAGGFRASYGYQNLMFLAAGMMVAKVSGMSSWAEFVERRIFAPLGMTESNTSIRALAGKDNVAQPHARMDDTVRTIPYRNADRVGPAGSINSNVLDMAKWLRFQLAGGKVDGKPLLGAAAFNETRTPQFTLRRSPNDKDGYFSAYGFGWFLQDYRGKFIVHHGGNIDGMTALVAMMPDEQVGVVVLTNMNGSPLPQLLTFTIFDRYLGGPAKDRIAELKQARTRAATRAREQAAEAESKRVKGTTPTLALEKYAASYADSANGTVAVTLENGKLVARYGTQFTAELEHWHFDTFRAKWRNQALIPASLLTFGLDGSGRVTSLEVEQFGKFRRAPGQRGDR